MRFFAPWAALFATACNLIQVVFPVDEDSETSEQDTAIECLVSGCGGEICDTQVRASPCTYSCEETCLELSSCLAVEGACQWVTDDQVHYDECIAACAGTGGHLPIPPDQLCWDCHEDDRMYPGHYGGWDCGSCHSTANWSDYSLHPVRTPHGTSSAGIPTPETEWIVACADCHAVPGDYTQFGCGGCHLANDPGFLPHQTLTAINAAADATCLACHANGDF